MKRKLFLASLAFMSGILLKETIWTVIIITVFIFAVFVIKKYFSVIIGVVMGTSLILGAIYGNVYENIKFKNIKGFINTEVNIEGTVCSDGSAKGEETEYVLRNVRINDNRILSNILLKTSEKRAYGDKVMGSVIAGLPKDSRNRGGFSYRDYLRTKDIYLICEGGKIKTEYKNQVFFIEMLSNKIRGKIREFSNLFADKEKAVLQALMIGDNALIDDILEAEYRESGMIHLLVVSGGHIAFIILFAGYAIKFFNVGANPSKYILLGIITLYTFVAGLGISIIRAAVGTGVVIFAKIIGRQNDNLTTLALVADLFLFFNPLTIYSLSFQLSFMSVIGIVVAYPEISKFFKSKNSWKTDIAKKIYEFCVDAFALTLSVQIFILPINLYNFNTVYLGGFISNIFAMGLVGVIMLLSFVLFFVYLLFFDLCRFFVWTVEILIRLMNFIANIFANFLYFTVITPNALSIVVYYILVSYIFYVIGNSSEKSDRRSPFKRISITKKDSLLCVAKQHRVDEVHLFYERHITVNTEELALSVGRRRFNKRNICLAGVGLVFLLNFIPLIVPRDFQISVIDVGHGDSILITTRRNKAILIDTGGSYVSNNKKYDSGEQTIIPYLLDRGIMKLDMLILTHLDSDHIGGLEYILDNMKVDCVCVSINSGLKEGYEEIERFFDEKNVRVKKLCKNMTFELDNANFEVLSPDKVSYIDSENNDSIVLKTEYQGRTVLFMGDLEVGGEEGLIEKGIELESDILKLGHHGSSTSSGEKFLNVVKPKVALISVGTRFESIPGKDVLGRLKSLNSKVYRTDILGELIVIIKNGKLYIDSHNSPDSTY